MNSVLVVGGGSGMRVAAALLSCPMASQVLVTGSNPSPTAGDKLDSLVLSAPLYEYPAEGIVEPKKNNEPFYRSLPKFQKRAKRR